MARCPACGNVQPIPVKGSGPPPKPTGPAPREPLFPPPSAASYNFSEEAAKGAPNPFGQPAKPNPFADTTSPFNPYAAPSYSGAFQAPDRNEAYALNKVQGPAIALMVTFGIALALSLVSLVMIVVMIAQGEAEPTALLQIVFSLPLSIFVLYGANKMRRLEQHGIATAAAICAMIPCSGCCVLGIPFGIWALSVLNDSYVRAAFR
jgi:hypothetical protein